MGVAERGDIWPEDVDSWMAFVEKAQKGAVVVEGVFAADVRDWRDDGARARVGVWL